MTKKSQPSRRAKALREMADDALRAGVMDEATHAKITKPLRKVGTLKEFKDYTLAVVRGERKVDPNEPKIWVDRIDGAKGQGKAPRN